MSRLSRVLSVYHLFRTCQEVSFEELRQQLGASEKTFLRDIRLLERAGVLDARYERKHQAFDPVSLELRPMAEEDNQTRRRYTEKLRRLCLLMGRIAEEAEWSDTGRVELYRELFPEQSDRTRQRDYRELDTPWWLLDVETSGLHWERDSVIALRLARLYQLTRAIFYRLEETQ